MNMRKMAFSKVFANRTPRRACVTFLANSRANSTIQAAILLALVLPIAATSVAYLGKTVDVSFRQAHESLSGPTTAAPLVAVQEPSDPWRSAEHVAMFGIFALLVIAVVGLCLRFKHAAAKQEQAPQQQPLADEKVDHLGRLYEKRQTVYSILSRNLDQLLGDEVTVDKLMSTKIIAVLPKATRHEVESIMEENRIHHVFVHNGSRLIGIISDRDLPGVDEKAKAKSFMTPDPYTVSPHDLLSKAMGQMIQHRISCLPVVSGKQLVGALSTTDLILGFQAALRAASEISRAISTVGRTSTAPEQHSDEAAMGA